MNERINEWLRLQILLCKQIIIDEYLFLCGIAMGSLFVPPSPIVVAIQPF